jgi:hypothetical protein
MSVHGLPFTVHGSLFTVCCPLLRFVALPKVIRRGFGFAAGVDFVGGGYAPP